MTDDQQRRHSLRRSAAAAGAAIWAAVATAVVGATVVWAAPAASAQPDQLSCTDVGSDTECQSPGNVEINASPPAVDEPQYPYWEGDSVIGIPDEGGGELENIGPATGGLGPHR